MTALVILGLLAAGWLLGMASAIVLGNRWRKKQRKAQQEKMAAHVAAQSAAVIAWTQQKAAEAAEAGRKEVPL